MRKASLCAVLGASIGLLAVTGARAQDAAAGEKVFIVPSLPPDRRRREQYPVGPVLNGIVGRKAGYLSRLHLFRRQQEFRPHLG